MFKEILKATGRLVIEKTSATGSVETIEVPNLVVTTGKNFIAQRLGQSTPPAIMSHMAIGTNSAEPAVGQTTLSTENGRVALTSTVVNNNTVTYTATFPAGTGTGNIYEAGIFNDPDTNEGAMLCRTTFPLVTKQSGDSIAITWVVTIS